MSAEIPSTVVSDPQIAAIGAYAEQPFRNAHLLQLANAAGNAAVTAALSEAEFDMPRARERTLQEFLEDPSDLRVGDTVVGLTLGRELGLVETAVREVMEKRTGQGLPYVETPPHRLEERLRGNHKQTAGYHGGLTNMQVTFIKRGSLNNPTEQPPRIGEHLEDNFTLIATAQARSSTPRTSGAHLRAGTSFRLRRTDNTEEGHQWLDMQPVVVKDNKAGVARNARRSTVRGARLEREAVQHPFAGGLPEQGR